MNPRLAVRAATGIAISLTVGMMLYATSRYGAGVNTDSIGYLGLAGDIAERGGEFLGEALAVEQPPGYPAALAGLSRVTGIRPADVARGVGAGCAGIVVGLAALCVGRVTASPWLRGLVPFGVGLAMPMLVVCTMAWSEPLFMALVMAVLVLLSGPSRSPARIVLIGLLTAAAFLTRYAGAVLLPTVGLTVLARRDLSWRERGIRLALFAAVALGPIVLYVLRNREVSGTLLGYRLPAAAGFTGQAVLAARAVVSWSGVGTLQSHPWAALCALAGLGLALAGLGGKDAVRAGLLPHAVFVAGYAAFLVWSSSRVLFDPIDTRLMAPIHPSLVVLAAGLLAPEAARRPLGLAVLALLWFAGPVRATLRGAHERARQGAGGYSAVAWRESPLIRALTLEVPRDAVIFSNGPDAIGFLAGRSAEMLPPYRAGYVDSRPPVEPEALFREYARLDGAFIVWFDRKNRPHVYSPGKLAEAGRLEPVARFPDGAIYRFRSRNGSSDKVSETLAE